MSLVLKHVAVVNTELVPKKPTVYSSDLSLIGSSYNLMVSNEFDPQSQNKKSFIKIGIFEVEPIGSLRRDSNHLNKMELDSHTIVSQVRRNLLNANYSASRNPLNDVIAFPKFIAELYRLNKSSTVALLTEPFANAWFYEGLNEFFNIRK